MARVSARAGLYLLDDMEGFDRVVVVDAVQTGADPAGEVDALRLAALDAPGGRRLKRPRAPSALQLARAAGALVPSAVEAVLVLEVAEAAEAWEGLGPAVAAVVPLAVAAVRSGLRPVGAGALHVPPSTETMDRGAALARGAANSQGVGPDGPASGGKAAPGNRRRGGGGAPAIQTLAVQDLRTLGEQALGGEGLLEEEPAEPSRRPARRASSV